MLADQRVVAQAQQVQVERLVDVPGGAGQERVGHRPVDHRVAVGAAGGRPPGVEVLGRSAGLPHHDGGAAQPVDRPLEGQRVEPLGRASKLTTCPQA